MELGKIYFWTTTIKDWKPLLKQDKYKFIIIDILKELVQKKKIIVYGFVIMPNHFHVIWEMLCLNGKEMPHASFNKATAHLIVKDLKANNKIELSYIKVYEKERAYRVWQRDPLAIVMDYKEKLIQKLVYIHNNPLAERWNLAESAENYKWSSASFYETESNEFDFITNFNERF